MTPLKTILNPLLNPLQIVPGMLTNQSMREPPPNITSRANDAPKSNNAVKTPTINPMTKLIAPVIRATIPPKSIPSPANAP